MVVDQEVLSNCCGASMAGEPSNNFTNTTLEGRCSDCKEMAEFGNQASEDELRTLDDILSQAFTDGASDTMWQDERHIQIFATAKKELEALIRTEKLKLLAEVRERVIGENDRGTITDPDSPSYGEPYESAMADKDELQAELTKLEAEL